MLDAEPDGQSFTHGVHRFAAFEDRFHRLGRALGYPLAMCHEVLGDLPACV
jgi:hypothetical protein